ncbi:MAG: hypothetical protein A2V70_02410 [Planctomycetes bacterium RBG_13_63_9]|nr:MAG: hypothetical protein A2V70_02410 [Planctomycetes bacterium RBG_13_63_9]
MTITDLHNARAGPSMRWRRLVWQATAGFLFGYVVLHPASMVIFEWLDPRIGVAISDGKAGRMLAPIAHSFHFNMLSMGSLFGAIGALITTFYGYHRLVLTVQRDRLSEQLARNETLRTKLAQQTEILKQNNEELAGLELANRRTSQFMAHDFKTALGCVAGFSAQLLEQPQLRADRDVASALVCIRRQAHRMMGSVTDLLEFARVRERHKPRMTLISVPELLQEAVTDFSLPAHAEHITLGHNYPSCPSLWADPRLLRRVLCNLISNALKHNGPNTHVRLDAQVDEIPSEVLFSCCDDGMGIPPEALPAVFTEFATAGGCSGESAGLGLAFCKAVVEAHGGRIWCESTHQQGARFCFTVPLHKESHNVP